MVTWAELTVNVLAFAGTQRPAQAAELLNKLTNLSRSHAGESALRELQAKGAFNLITDYGNAGQIDKARALYENLATLAAAHDREPALRETQAKGAVNLINYYGNAGQLDKARALYEILATLAAAHDGEPVLQEMQANGAHNLTILTTIYHTAANRSS